MKRTLALISCALALAFVGGSTLISAEGGVMKGKATVRAIHGLVQYQINGGPLMKVRVNQTLDEGAIVITGPDSYTDLSVNGVSSVVRINPDSKLDLRKMDYTGAMVNGDRNTFLDLQAGQILGNVKKISAASTYEIQTPHGVAGIRGTDFQVSINVRPDGSFSVTFTSVQGQVIVSATVGGAPVVHTLNTGESWTPGQGEVVQTPVGVLQNFLNTIRIIETFIAPSITPLPPPAPFNNGSPPEQHPSSTTPS